MILNPDATLLDLTAEDLSHDLADYDFDLPDDLIAQTPIEPRHASRLLVLNRHSGVVDHRGVADLPTLLTPGTLLVVNDTRVVPARLLAHKDTGGKVELLLTRPFASEGADLTGHEVLVKSSKGLHVGQKLLLDGVTAGPTARVMAVEAGGKARVDFAGVANLTDLLEGWGHVPLPPYIRGGKDDPSIDRPRYQCTFADRPGAVAAPTAGLHLSQALLQDLASAGIELCRITLHVGPGTFLPVRTDDLRQHAVLPERYDVGALAAEQLERARRAGRPIVAVGTTTTRTLETVILRNDGVFRESCGDADLTILPGHRFGGIRGLMTNFHLPKSSLLVLVCSFAGRSRVLAAYRQAVAERYRFYSYGDAMLIREDP